MASHVLVNMKNAQYLSIYSLNSNINFTSQCTIINNRKK